MKPVTGDGDGGVALHLARAAKRGFGLGEVRRRQVALRRRRRDAPSRRASRRWRGSAPFRTAPSPGRVRAPRWRGPLRRSRAPPWPPRPRQSAASTCASISRRSIVAIVWPSVTASPMSTSTRSSVPGSSRLDRHAAPRRERAGDFERLRCCLTVAVTTGTSTAVRVVRRLAWAVGSGDLQPAAAMRRGARTRTSARITIH